MKLTYASFIVAAVLGGTALSSSVEDTCRNAAKGGSDPPKDCRRFGRSKGIKGPCKWLHALKACKPTDYTFDIKSQSCDDMSNKKWCAEAGCSWGKTGKGSAARCYDDASIVCPGKNRYQCKKYSYRCELEQKVNPVNNNGIPYKCNYRPPGSTCSENKECFGDCFGGHCCMPGIYLGDCDGCDDQGRCVCKDGKELNDQGDCVTPALAKVGEPCTMDAHCESDNCRDPGVCHEPELTSAGGICSENANCESGQCSAGKCCLVVDANCSSCNGEHWLPGLVLVGTCDACPDGHTIDETTFKCVEEVQVVADGDSCTSDDGCESGKCKTHCCAKKHDVNCDVCGSDGKCETCTNDLLKERGTGLCKKRMLRQWCRTDSNCFSNLCKGTGAKAHCTKAFAGMICTTGKTCISNKCVDGKCA